MALPLAKSREVRPGLTVHRDFQDTTHQFHLGKHLMNPTPSDLREGIENSRRLAGNAIKLGIDDETHRDVSIFPLNFDLVFCTI